MGQEPQDTTQRVIDRFNAAFQQHDPALLGDRSGAFELEDTRVFGEEALIFWRYRWGPGGAESVRGINVMRVRGGAIVQGRGYVKAAAAGGAA